MRGAVRATLVGFFLGLPGFTCAGRNASTQLCTLRLYVSSHATVAVVPAGSARLGTFVLRRLVGMEWKFFAADKVFVVTPSLGDAFNFRMNRVSQRQ